MLRENFLFFTLFQISFIFFIKLFKLPVRYGTVPYSVNISQNSLENKLLLERSNIEDKKVIFCNTHWTKICVVLRLHLTGLLRYIWLSYISLILVVWMITLRLGLGHLKLLKYYDLENVVGI